MKKFLKLEHSLCSKKVPDELDIPVLAAAAMRAKSFRRRRTMLKVVLPGTISTIAAAAALLIMMPSMTITPVPGKAVSGTSVNTAKLKIQTNPETIVEQNVSQYDMLALVIVRKQVYGPCTCIVHHPGIVIDLSSCHIPV